MSDQKNTITVEIDPNAELPQRYLGTDEDGPSYGPMSLYDCIIRAAADRLVGYGEKVVRELIVEQMQDSIAEQVTERLKPIMEAAFDEEVTIGDGFSSETHTLRDLIGKRVREQAGLSGKNSYGSRTVLDEVVREQIDHSLKEVFTADVQAGKAKLRETLQAKAAELLAAESLREAGIR